MASPDKVNLIERLTSPTANTILLVIVLVVAIVALVYSVKNHDSLDDLEHPKKKESMTGGPVVVNALRETACSGGGCADSGATTRPVDGSDYSNRIQPNTSYPNGRITCPSAPTTEPHHAYVNDGAPTYKLASQSYASTYPQEIDPHALDGQANNCAPDAVTSDSNCSYNLNSDSLMPGSWRDETQCPDGSDPNSQWAKYSVAKEKFYNYLTASSAARLGVNTRTASSRITGLPLLLRSSTITPVTSKSVPFNGSSLAADAFYNTYGFYPDQSDAC